MRHLWILVAICLVAFLFLACVQEPEPVTEEVPDVQADETALMAWFDKEMEATKQGDIDAALALCSDDAVNMPPNTPAIEGKDAYRQWLQQSGEQSDVLEYVLTVKEIEVQGDWAFVRGVYDYKWQPKAGGDIGEDAGKFLNIFERSNGSWKSTHSIWNSDNPRLR